MKNFSIPLVSQNRPKYIPSLDGLRGFAVWAVIFYHCFSFLIVTKIGWAGVDLFFVLSGFLITGILYDTKSSPNYYKNFIIRRVLRIFPLYYFALITMFFILPNIIPELLGSHFDYYQRHQSYFWLYIQNWLYSIDGFPHNHMLVHFWSLAVEEQFYIFWPWVIKFCPLKHLLKISIILIILSIFFRMNWGFSIGYQATFQYMATLSRMDALLIGAVIAILLRRRPAWLEKAVLPALVFSFIVVVAGIAALKRVNFLSLPSLYTFMDLFFASILILCLSSKNIPFLTKLVNNNALIWSGKYSYGLYVYHYIIFIILEFNITNGLSRLFDSTTICKLITGLITIILSLIISYLSYQYLESPFLRLKKHFSYKNKRPITLKTQPACP
jgi:peptidoglycan/LPS O-acetylase OafA/YrhL